MSPSTALILSALTLLAPVEGVRSGARVSPPVRLANPCLPGEIPRPLSLPELWELGRSSEPGYEATRESIAAEQAFRTSVQREWIPSFSLTGIGNFGQRLSPGEERILGVGPRGELRLLGAWTVLESDRSPRALVGARRVDQAVALGAAFDATHRGQLARLYVDAATTEGMREIHDGHVARLAELAAPVRQRLASGVDASWEAHLIEEAVSRADRLLADLDQLTTVLRTELAMVTGACVRAAGYAAGDAPAPLELAAAANPEVLHLRSLAGTHEALAREESERGRWQLQVIGTLGPNHSRAFDDGPWRNEYLVGLSGNVGLDLGGVRRQLAASERARARSIEAEAESLQQALERDLERSRIELEHARQRRTGLQAEINQAAVREEAALLRWQEGIDQWTEVLGARERVLELHLLDMGLQREMALALIRQGEITGDLASLPGRLGQESPQ